MQRRCHATRILVPVDFSEESLLGLEHAARIARNVPVEVEILHVIAPCVRPVALYPPRESPEAAWRRHARECKRSLDALARRILGEARTWHSRVRVANRPEDGIVEWARRSGVDMIVIGACDSPGPSHLVHSSISHRVIRSAPCPVLRVCAGSEKRGTPPCENPSSAAR